MKRPATSIIIKPTAGGAVHALSVAHGKLIHLFPVLTKDRANQLAQSFAHLASRAPDRLTSIMREAFAR